MATTFVSRVHVFSGNVTTTSASLVQVAQSRTRLDTAHFDGNPVYTLVLNLRLSAGAQTATIELQPAGGGPAVLSFTHTGDTSVDRIVSSSFSPTSGANDYELWISVSGGATLAIYSAVLLVAQDETYTKAVVDWSLTRNSGTGMNVSTTPSELNPSLRFLYEGAKWDSYTAEFHTVGNNGGGGTLTLDLYDGSSAMATNTHTTNGATLSIDSSVTTLVDGTEYYVRGTASAGTDVASKATLRFILTAGFTKCQVPFFCGGVRADNANDWGNSSTNTNRDCLAHRALIDLSLYDAAKQRAAYFESIALSAAASGDTIQLMKVGSTDNGAGSPTSVVSNANTSATKLRTRSSDILSGFANERYYARNAKGATAGSADPVAALVLLEFGPSASSDVFIQGLSAIDRGVTMQTAARLGGVLET